MAIQAEPRGREKNGAQGEKLENEMEFRGRGKMRCNNYHLCFLPGSWHPSRIDFFWTLLFFLPLKFSFFSIFTLSLSLSLPSFFSAFHYADKIIQAFQKGYDNFNHATPASDTSFFFIQWRRTIFLTVRYRRGIFTTVRKSHFPPFFSCFFFLSFFLFTPVIKR